MNAIWKPSERLTAWKPNTQLELYHFGVKGMRWRRRKNSTAEAEAGASSAAAGSLVSGVNEMINGPQVEEGENRKVKNPFKPKEAKKVKRPKGETIVKNLLDMYMKAAQAVETKKRHRRSYF